jgi:hypothetical protein
MSVRSRTGWLAVCAVLPLAAAGVVLAGRAATLTGPEGLDAVAAVSAHDAWAVGFAGGFRPPGARTVIEHWDGAGWRRVASPPGGSRGRLTGVTALSARDVWAVGWARGAALILHWNGIRWRRVPAPGLPDGVALNAVAASSARDVWAVGMAGRRALIARWDGAAWRRVTVPAAERHLELTGVAAVSGRDAWAVGVPGGAILHWNGAAWAVTPSPFAQFLYGIAAVSARAAWAVGETGGVCQISGVRPFRVSFFSRSWSLA